MFSHYISCVFFVSRVQNLPRSKARFSVYPVTTSVPSTCILGNKENNVHTFFWNGVYERKEIDMGACTNAVQGKTFFF